jgi:hypothetical protein
MLVARQIHKKYVIALLCVSLLTLGGAPKAVATGASCGTSTVVRDFLEPLSKMPTVHSLPPSGKLPFGPDGLSLWSKSGLVGNGLVVGPGSVGFEIDDEAVEHRRRLEWLIVTSLSRVNSAGKVISQITRSSRRLGSVKVNNIGEFMFDVPGSPSFYRVDIVFRRLGTNRLLGRFSQYARVMRPRTDVRVAIDRPIVMPGEMARAMLFNYGTVAVSSVAYDFGFDVQRFDGSGWITVPENPPRERVRKRIQILPPGTENRGCLRYLVTQTQPPGRYRFSYGTLAAEFQVAPTP